VLWSDGTSHRSRRLAIRSAIELRVGLELGYLVRASFTDRNGTELDATEVDSITVVDDHGRARTMPGYPLGVRGPTATRWQRHPAGARWLSGTSVRLDGGLRAAHVTYEAREIVVGGERIKAAPDPFTPAEGRVWTIAADAHAVELGTRDALFGLGADHEVTLTHPSGRAQTVSSGDTVLLPAGTYGARADAAGIPFPASFSVPESDSATVRILSLWDVAALILLLAGVGALLVARSSRVAQARAAPDTGARRRIAAPRDRSEPTDGETARAREPSGDGRDAKEYVRVHMRSGRTIEGWVSATSSDQVMLLTVVTVRDAMGHEVVSTPLDSFLARSRIERVEVLDAPVRDPSRPEEAPPAPQLRVIEGEDATGTHPDKRGSRSAS
jgi:hypothetical protein